jgi:hypothetical protein
MDTEISYEDLKEISEMAFPKRKKAVNEAKDPSHSAQDARDKLERARDEANRALEELRRVQSEFDANQRIGSEIKSAMSAVIDVEKSVLTAIHKIENVIHRINKMATSPQEESVQKKSLMKEDMEIEIPFKHKGQELVALFDVEAIIHRRQNGDYALDEDPKIKLLSITEKGDPNKEVETHLSIAELHELQDEALERYIEDYKQEVA